ncbi:PREDICTED: biotin carboxyl carrier protein of acetyl-CoA carboxylase 2, chloroplastic-like [Camelina sativa]|uniref:Biotin carboxyl carrier protein of acetyl-CoA carboxylase n=1 Tax=Camelina sativa TaxID=90675 RepID=A0ABM0VBD2_CAMSA|nr:PREDICTED: biotin carboxyl carrier protein of acetyl-CoA carboxylase 2, chloroplastic-like [Camelina sativa]
MASLSVPCAKICAPNRQVCSLPGISTRRWQPLHSGISFPSGVSQTHSTIWRLSATTNEVVSNSSPVTNGGYLNGKAKTNVPESAELSEFMAKVSGLLKLVDSRDIVELELKQLDCEIVIRKKEALQQAAPPAPVYHSMPPLMADLPMPPAQSVAPPPPPPTPASTSASAKPTTAPSSSQPPLKSPMAGTFYRSPGPGEPPFVKVGDKVQKGQVVCIIEAMKLMNEIEAEKSGTITELLAEDGKPVSVDTPLFVIVS